MNTRLYMYITLLAVCVIACNEAVDYDSFNGVFIERYSASEPYSYDLDNLIYTPGTTFVFDYDIYKHGDSGAYHFQDTSQSETFPLVFWNITQKTMEKQQQLTQMHVTVLKEKMQDLEEGSLAQSQIVFKMMKSDYTILGIKSRTGLVENDRNIWMHPIRLNNFKILQLTPYPFVKLPLTIGQEYEWYLDIGEQWASPQWIEWKGNIRNECSYRVTEKREIHTPMGRVDCYMIKAIGKSPVGSSMAEFAFSEKYGFVQLNYTCVNGDRINFNLVDVR